MKSGRLNYPRATKYEPWTFCWVRRSAGGEMPALIVRVDGNEVTYRALMPGGTFATENTIHASRILRPAAKHEFRISWEKLVETHSDRRPRPHEISLPKPDGSFEPVGSSFPSRYAAVREAKDKFGADSHGRIMIVNELPEVKA